MQHADRDPTSDDTSTGTAPTGTAPTGTAPTGTAPTGTVADGRAMTSVELLAAQRREASRRRRPRRDAEPNTVIWWHLANVIDLVHFPILIGLVVLGAVYFSGPVFVFLLTLMVTLQAAVLGCPVMWLTGQLRKIHDPDYEVKWSFTAWLYQRYGRWFGVAVFCLFAGLTLLLRFWLF